MRRSRTLSLSSAVIAFAGIGLLVTPASADHTDPRVPQSVPTEGPIAAGTETGAGDWNHLYNSPSNPGTDLEFLKKGRKTLASSGTLGQGEANHVGQRIVQLVNNGKVRPKWVADHGSAHCATANPGGTTGLQHDAQVTPKNNTQLIIDTTDATGRCHDGPGGGLELIDVTRLNNSSFKPREIHLTRHVGTSHTVTVDATRPWIVYNSTSTFNDLEWIDVLDIRSCLGLTDKALARKRSLCRPKVYRITFQPQWSQARSSSTGQLKPGTESSCHDITAKGNRLYCAALNATLVFNVAGLTDAAGNVRGTPLNCPVIDGTRTGAKVTDCSGTAGATQQATGWSFLGSFNHPGRECDPTGTTTTCNSNTNVRSDQGVAVAHEADPSPNNQNMFVTDERGGGVVPPGSSCQPGIDNPFGNGGVHVFDIGAPANISYEQKADGSKAVWIGDSIVPAQTFCTVHVIEHIPDEQRIIVAYYTQGTKILDYFIDSAGRWHFRETASFVLPGANTWAVEPFKIRNNPNGTRTYFMLASDIQRGQDVISWTGPKNPIGAPVPPALLASSTSSDSTINLGLLAATILIPAAAWIGGRRRREGRRLGRLGWAMITRS